MKTIAENANDFAAIRTMDKGNCIYVDKTDYFHRLVTAPGKNLFFIARPRRFGKSLMITTFKYIFQGRRELFKGLKIDSLFDQTLNMDFLKSPECQNAMERTPPSNRTNAMRRCWTRLLMTFAPVDREAASHSIPSSAQWRHSAGIEFDESGIEPEPKTLQDLWNGENGDARLTETLQKMFIQELSNGDNMRG